MQVPRRGDLAERVMAEAWGAGALGLEERDEGEVVRLVIYFSPEAERALQDALSRFVGQGVRRGTAEAVEEVDWAERWKQGLEAIAVSERLVVRPSFVAHELAAGQQELLIDPGQAFGTGGHASTLLALRWIDALLARAEPLAPAMRVLDVGTGTGVLAMAALRLGAGSAVAFDLDPSAVAEASIWAARNGLADRMRLFAGPLAALAGELFDLVLVNLLKREMLPIAGEIARSVRSGGRVVLSGLLPGDRDEVLRAFSARGLVACDETSLRDAGGDEWISPLMERPDAS